MIYRRSSMTTTGLAVLFAMTLACQAWALDACRPSSPSPCGVDGECRPNTLLWGHYRTRWRSWPGEARQADDTPDVAEPGQDELELPPFERPIPEKENLRGPKKTKSDNPNEESDSEEAADDAVLPEPPGDAFPDFDLQGNRPGMPIPRDDAPPALPNSLRRIAGKQAGRPIAATRVVAARSVQPQLSRPLATAKRTGPPRRPTRRRPVAARPRPVVQANAQMSSQIQLVNPAAKNVGPEGPLKAAVYYEATDAQSGF